MGTFGNNNGTISFGFSGNANITLNGNIGASNQNTKYYFDWDEVGDMVDEIMDLMNKNIDFNNPKTLKGHPLGKEIAEAIDSAKALLAAHGKGITLTEKHIDACNLLKNLPVSKEDLLLDNNETANTESKEEIKDNSNGKEEENSFGNSNSNSDSNASASGNTTNFSNADDTLDTMGNVDFV